MKHSVVVCLVFICLNLILVSKQPSWACEVCEGRQVKVDSEGSAIIRRQELITNYMNKMIQSQNQAGTNPAFAGGPIARIELLMRIWIGDLNSVDQYGFRNTFYPRGVQGWDFNARSRYENGILGFSELKLPPGFPIGFPPSYGYLNYFTTENDVAKPFPFKTAHEFGNIILVLKNSILNRTTYSGDDSLAGRGAYVVPTYFLSDLSKLIDFHSRKDLSYYLDLDGHEPRDPDYLEAQVWGGLTFDDVAEILLTAPEYSYSSEILPDVHRIAKKYGHKVYFAEEVKDLHQHIQMKKTLLFDYSRGHSGRPAFVPLAKEELVKRYLRNFIKVTEMNVIIDLLAERGPVDDLPFLIKRKAKIRREENESALSSIYLSDEIPFEMRQIVGDILKPVIIDAK